ncbi:class A beta-lactamase-related serine hydrolase [Aeromicrobium phragmitis]|uniref:Class A beta-lactamase-related serine hydrolase n=1 Tax=Aeromicrobium phragmitis TaxID=2478914 RepID=A0A3L8PL40_9ACTN|nr:serine hydrolase domain-containing protein [Aeromicrobium phragmitis]RLV55960.1 class A beta-lactamase-related serine hydrolase [Aeromicrobium phragmitis]
MTDFDERLRREYTERRLPSVTAAVVSPDALIWAGAVGTRDGRDGAIVDRSTRYRIGSVTKTLVAVAVLRAREGGLLDLSTRVRQLLPDAAHASFADVTVAQLLTHTSGLQAETNGPWWERSPGGDWVALRDAGLRLVHPPGTRFHYSNVGFAILGRVLEQLHGRSWFDVVRDDVLEPIGAADAMSLRPDASAAAPLAVHPHEDLLHAEPEFDAGAMAPAGQVWSSIDGLARWAQFALSDGSGLVSAATMDLMRVPLAVDDRLGAGWDSAQGLGWRVWHDGGRRFVGHGGSMPGFLATLKVEPARGVGVVVLTNTTHGLGDLTDDLLRLAEDVVPAPPATDREPSTPVRRLLGDWYWGPAHFVVESHADGFLLRPAEGAGRGSRFAPDGDGWRGLDGYYAGEHLSVRSDGALDLASFIFTRQPYDPAHSYPGDLDPAGWH